MGRERPHAAVAARRSEAPVGPSPVWVGPWGHATPAPTEVDRQALAVIASVDGIGPLTLERLVERLGSPAEVLAVAVRPGAAGILMAAGRDTDGVGRAIPASVAAALVVAAARRDELLDRIARLELRIVARGDPEYPRRLESIEVPPPVLFVRGAANALAADHSVGVVGTRRPSDLGRRTASRIGAALARAGAVVVSGLAIGIDGAAHAAVVGEGGRTVAILGGGHGRLSPRAHERLAGAIVDAGGAIVSEHAPDTEPTHGTFPRRNRLISGAADAVVVVEAGARSGALLTASWALEQGRECFLVPGPIDAPASAGCLGFLRDWPGLARIVAGVPQLLDDLGLVAAAGLGPEGRESAVRSGVSSPSTAALLVDLGPAERQVAASLVAGATIVDEIVAVTGLPVGAVLGAITRLETAGLVVGAHGRYRVAGPLAASPAA